MRLVQTKVLTLVTLLTLGCGGESAGTEGDPSAGGTTNNPGGSAAVGGTTSKTIASAGGAAGSGSQIGTGGLVGTGGTDSTYPFGGAGSLGGAAAVGGTSGQGGATATTTTPPECQAPLIAGISLPQLLTFQLVNRGTTPKYLSFGTTCSIQPILRTCSDGYSKVLQTMGGCAVNCSSTFVGCIACAMCAPIATEVLPGASTSVSWQGKLYTMGVVGTPACSCYNESVAPVGKYRATLSVYDSQAAALAGTGTPSQVTVDFTYPDPDGIITLAL